jgi:hypothetical protein
MLFFFVSLSGRIPYFQLLHAIFIAAMRLFLMPHCAIRRFIFDYFFLLPPPFFAICADIFRRHFPPLFISPMPFCRCFADLRRFLPASLMPLITLTLFDIIY